MSRSISSPERKTPKSLISVAFPNLHLVTELILPGIPHLASWEYYCLPRHKAFFLYWESYGQSSGAHSVHEAQVRLLPHPLFNNAWLKLINFSWGGRGEMVLFAELAELAGTELKSEDTTATWTEASTGNEAGRAKF